MTTPSLFKEYIWLVNTIREHRRISFAEIQKCWTETEMSGGVELARSTFNRHKDAIEDIFGIIIECDRKNGYRYYIENADVLEEDTVQNWMLSTLSVSDIISQSMSLHDRILLQQVPCSEYLNLFLEAMKKKVRVTITYRRYAACHSTCVTGDPYCLKLFNQRWYVLMHFHREAASQQEERDYFGVYAFDRIQSLALTDTKFAVRDDFDAQQFFGECFGVVVGDGTQPEHIVLRAYGSQRFYMADLPLHHSQQLVAETEDYADYAFYLRPTYDFCAHIFGLAGQLKVLQPQSLADHICQMARETLQRYGEEKK